jgi:hypothetical protein
LQFRAAPTLKEQYHLNLVCESVAQNPLPCAGKERRSAGVTKLNAITFASESFLQQPF